VADSAVVALPDGGEMTVSRLLRHLLTPDWMVRLAFPAAAMHRIEEAIAASERTHSGQVRFAVEAALDPLSVLRGVSARDRAIDVFSALRLWDTERNNGVLIYLLLADRDVEIVADRGIAARVGRPQWETVCTQMEALLHARQFERALLTGISAVGAHLAQHFAPQCAGNELPDQPSVL
jgi:uncharacterized membrane protein